jgi:tetratricopeptide (TPR) repeat protein
METLSHPYFSDETMALTFNNKILFFNTQAICYTNISQHTKALDMVRKLVKHNESRPDKIKADPKNYLMALSNWSSIATNCGQFDEANRALDKLEQLRRRKDVNMPKTTRDHIIGSVMESRLAMYVFDLQQYEKGIEYYHKTKADIDANGLDLHSSAMLWRHYELAMCYFFTGQYGPALEELRVYLHDHDDQRSDYLLCVHLLHIMVHYELGNLSILPHLVRATRRFADTRGFKEKSIGIFAQLFNQLSKTNDNKGVSVIAKSYLPKFEALNSIPQEHSICHSIAIERWLTAKI